MNAQDFARLRSGKDDCPSDLALDRLHAGELPSAEAQRLTAHIKGCSLCPERMALRQAGFDALPEVDARPILSTIRRRLHESEQVPAARRWLRQLGLLLAPMAAATAALAVLLVIRKAPEHPPGPPPTAAEPDTDVVRAKGGLGLHVYRQGKSDGPTEASGQATVSGEQFAPGDRLRFVVDLPRSGQVTIVGIEATGELYVAWPSPGSAESTLRPTGPGQELPGAVALDSSRGRETLYLVHCPQASAPPQCTSQGAQARPQCGTGCAMVSFVINKEPG
jgi:hypothetical protein